VGKRLRACGECLGVDKR